MADQLEQTVAGHHTEAQNLRSLGQNLLSAEWQVRRKAAAELVSLCENARGLDDINTQGMSINDREWSDLTVALSKSIKKSIRKEVLAGNPQMALPPRARPNMVPYK